MKVLYRKLVDRIYNLLGLYAPERCVFCGVQTSCALSFEVNKYGWPCCTDCEEGK